MPRNARSPWPAGVRRKRAKGKYYFYWFKSNPPVRLPDPSQDADGFMRKLAHLQRTAIVIETRRREGSFAELVELWKASPQFPTKHNTRDSYTRYIDRLVRAYPGALLTEIEGHDFQKRVMDKNGSTPGAADQMLSVFRAFAKWAGKRIKGGFTDPTRGIEYFGPRGEHEPWPDHIINAALASEDDELRLGIALLLFTGQRIGDCCDMPWSAIRGDQVAVRQEKTDEPLLIPIHPALQAELAKAKRAGPLILSSKQGRRLRPATLRRWIENFCKQFGVHHVPHGLRKNATIELVEAGCTTFEAAAVTGHKSLRMIEHYSKQYNRTKAGRSAVLKWSNRERENNLEEGKQSTQVIAK